jgi:hypothetical protein
LVEYLEGAKSTNFSTRVQESCRPGLPNQKRYPSFSSGHQSEKELGIIALICCGFIA